MEASLVPPTPPSLPTVSAPNAISTLYREKYIL